MRRWGFFLIGMSIASAVLPLMGFQLMLLGWVDMWGPDAGWLIRALLVGIGVVMVLKARSAEGGAQRP